MELFACEKPLVGMLHLRALPGSPRYDGRTLSDIVDLALEDLEALEAGEAAPADVPAEAAGEDETAQP